MANFVAKALTSVHVGSGQVLKKNIDFFNYKSNNQQSNDRSIGIINYEKVFNTYKNEFKNNSDFEKWISIIEGKSDLSFYDFIKKHIKRSIDVDEITSRKLTNVYGDFANVSELKEQLINADNQPYIPGSSLKGAIRTAIISHIVKQNNKLKSKIKEYTEEIFKDNNTSYKEKMNKLKTLENNLLNHVFAGSYFNLDKKSDKEASNKNLMRFLHVGDIVFYYETQGTVMRLVNFANRWKFKNEVTAIIETISYGCESEPFRILIKNDFLNIAKEKKYIINDNINIIDYNKITEIVNEHTKTLLKEEIEFMNNQEFEDEEFKENYLETLKNVEEEFTQINQGEMIIRLGGYTGWRSITGAWIENILDKDTWKKIYLNLNKNRNVAFFPKTRKSDDYADAFGFLKIEKTSN